MPIVGSLAAASARGLGLFSGPQFVVNYFIVAAGGPGGSAGGGLPGGGGGGGGGQVLIGSSGFPLDEAIPVQVAPSTGGNSFLGPFIAAGGNSGNTSTSLGGGPNVLTGGGTTYNSPVAGSLYTGGVGVRNLASGIRYSGGGAGAGGNGGDATISSAGAGGPGVLVQISTFSQVCGPGGPGGDSSATTPGVNATALGGGGGGAYSGGNNRPGGGALGGTVIIEIPTGYGATFSGFSSNVDELPNSGNSRIFRVLSTAGGMTVTFTKI